MFFLIRCVFWLSLVFSTIFSAQSAVPQAARTEAPAHRVPPLGGLTRNWLETAASFVEREAAAHCLETDCWRSHASEAGFAPQRGGWANVPLPPRRPPLAPPKSRPALENSARAEYVMSHSRRS